MNDKRLQLFGMYSMSIIFIISLFSLAIYLNVNVNERKRVENQLSTHMHTILDGEKTYTEIEQIVNDSGYTAAIWRGTEKTLVIAPRSINTESIQFPNPFMIDSLENITVLQETPFIGTPQRMTYYSYSSQWQRGDNTYILQLLYNSHDTNRLLNNLTNILLVGTLIVSMLGIGLGILLAYLNMLPVMTAWMQQRSFVADASHELRTPLSVITLKSDSLLKHSGDPIIEHVEDVAVIQQECRRMHKMVDSLLFLAKKDSGVVDLEFQEFRVQQLLTDLEITYSEFFEIENKQLIIENSYKEHVLGDYEKVKQVFMIIIDNALRFTKEGDYIKISVEVKSGRVVFHISNNGEPLNEKDLPFIFERFYKGNKSRSKEENGEGNGLGLSIAQEIVVLHQSKIKAVSVDGITTFSFSLQKK